VIVEGSIMVVLKVKIVSGILRNPVWLMNTGVSVSGCRKG
jgi:hypothetical protein